MQGAFLRERLGEDYVSAAVTFGAGSFNATGPDGTARVHTVGAPPRHSTERFLDRVRPGDYLLDLRTSPPAARTWLHTPRPTPQHRHVLPGAPPTTSPPWPPTTS